MAPPDLVPDIVGEILLLLPPDDPATLVRASLVCKPWRRLLSGRAFRRRYRAFHGAPPLLGFLHDHYAHGAVASPRFVPSVSPSPIPQPPRRLGPRRRPPDDPATLVRASLVCKPWQRLISGRDFRRRYRAFHGALPLLGFLHDHYARGAVASPRFVPSVSPSPIPQPVAALGLGCGYRDWSVLDCRHGHVLFDIFGGTTSASPYASLVVWDPVVGRRHSLPLPPIVCWLYGAAVLCAVRGCDHLDCHGGPFLVVLPALNFGTATVMQVQTYSSETGAWKFSARRDLRHHVLRKPSTLIGDCIYFRLDSASTAILRYDMGKNRLSTIDAPASHVFKSGFAIMPMVDGSLGFADIRGSQVCIWSKNVNTEVSAGWEQCGVIELGTLIPESRNRACVVGSVEGAYVIFVNNGVGVFPVGLKSGRVGKISKPGHYDAVFPFISFYTQIV
ncbi:unnamed protein product [Urochloa decumbens]|uniref:F-box domain-containing protein n=1 Tax=Urochloa decumbens TaxID=240449 RepID=A0ABC9GV22_9POAL